MATNIKNPINIFIVEDNNVFKLALKADIESSFSNIPMTIHSFETGEACMEKFSTEKPNVVILDYHLNSNHPEAADGIKVLNWIKKESPDTNVIMLTGEDHIDIALRSFKAGASDYIVKTETKFRKINYSLYNLFKIMEAKTEAKRYKQIAVGLFLSIALLVIGVIAVQIFNPFLLK
jgi:DNA-binding NarL/FixJ family response regulator